MVNQNVCKKKVSIMGVWCGYKNPSLGITGRYHSANLVMPISGPRDRFFCSHHTPMKDTNRLYDAALLTRCYTQHALRPVIDSKINHIRHFIKIPFINKGMDFIDLPSIFRDKSVQSSIPNYFKNCEVPIICYKYNKPIRGAIFNFNKLVSDLNIETCTPDS